MGKINISKTSFGLIVIALYLGGCQSFGGREFDSNDIECLDPPFSLAFVTGEIQGTDDRPPLRLADGWEPQLPVETQDLESLWDITVANDGSVWLINENNQIFRYLPQTGEIREYQINLPDEDWSIDHRQLFLIAGQLWILSNEFSNDEIRLFSYNFDNDQLVNVTDAEGVFRLETAISNIVVDQSGDIWVANYNQQLIRFDPDTLIADIMLEKEDGYSLKPISTRLTVSPDGTLWMLADRYYPDGSMQYIFAIEYDPETGEVTEHEIHAYPDSGVGPGKGQPVMTLFFDHTNRLWISNQRFLQVDENGDLTWYEVVRSPVFYTDRMAPLSNSYQFGKPVLESQNRYLWFQSNAGVIRLDLESDEWCLMANLSSPIAEDQENNIWIAGEGQIYKLEQLP